MHVHSIISSPVFTEPLVKRIQDYYQDNYIILVSESFQKIQCITAQGTMMMDIFRVISWLKRQDLETFTAHFLSTQAAYIVRNLPKETYVKWLVWGGDFYGLPNLRNLYLKGTKKKNSLKERVGYRLIKSILPRINTIVANACDTNQIKEQIDVNADFLPLNHLWSIDSISRLDKIKNNHILVGNSSDRYNNHLKVIDILNGLISNESVLLVPLSGVTNGYTKSVKVTALNNFPNCQLLNAFIPFGEYNKMLAQCSILVYGHLRQQGMATLFSFLESGRKCYFFKDNVYFQYLKKEGFHVFALEHTNSSKFWQPLTKMQADQNRSKLYELLKVTTIENQWKQALSKQ